MTEEPREDELVPHQATPLVGERLLVLAAHPDDETLGAGGTLALNAGEGRTSRIWIATDGERQEGAQEDPAYASRRRDEARRAAGLLGLPEPVFAGMPDRGLSSRRRELASELGREIREFGPDLVLCPSPVEIHPDHRALAEALYELIAASRPGDVDHDSLRFPRIAYYELTQPILPNVLVDIASAVELKREALAAYSSQQAVRDYSGAVEGLNAYRRLTLEGAGPVEAFRLLEYGEISTRSLEQVRRSIGPAIIADGGRGIAPVSVVVRTHNRPALLAEALDSLRSQTARPHEVVVVNDGGSPVGDVVAPFRDVFDLSLHEQPDREGRSRAANRGVEAARSDLVAFLDDDDRFYPDHFERLVRAFRAGPEPVVYSDAATVVYERQDDHWQERLRTLQYSLDFDPDYLLLANYIPLHTLTLPRGLYGKAGGFDPAMEYSEDWDFLIRLSAQTAFRHVRAVTCEYRVFSEAAADPTHAAAGGPEFLRARQLVYQRYASRRTPEGLARVIDRMRAQIVSSTERDASSQGELRYQRNNRRRIEAQWEKARAQLAALRPVELERRSLLVENEIVHARLAELYASNERMTGQLQETRVEIDRLNAILQQIYGSRTWRLHLFLDRIRGRR